MVRTQCTKWQVLLAALLVPFAVLAPSARARADTVPFSDPNAVGILGLCDAGGHPISSGSLSARPFVARAVSSVAAPQGYHAEQGGKATLFGFQPRNGVDPADWSGRQLTASSYFSNDAHPMTDGTPLDYSLADFLSVYPARWTGLVQLRMFLGAPNSPTITSSYAATVVRVSGNTWTVVNNGTVDCSDGRTRSIERVYLPAAQLKAASASAASAKTAAGAAGSASGDSTSGARSAVASSSGSAMAGGAANPSTTARRRAGAPAVASASPVAARHDARPALAGATWLAVAAAVIAMTAAALFRYARRRRAPL